MSILRPTIQLDMPPRPAPDFTMAIVNIILLLLLFFLLLGGVAGGNIAVPRPAETLALDQTDLPKPLLIIAADGGWEIDGMGIDPDLALARLAAAPDPALHILAAAELPAERLLAALTSLQPLGRQITLVTLDRTPGGARP